MAWISAENVVVDIPVFDNRSKSLKSLIEETLWRSRAHRQPNIELATVRALDNISLRLVDGDRIGLIGRNGCGKSTLLRVLAGIYEPTKGQVRVSGRTSALLDLTFGIDMEATGIENIYLRGYAIGMTQDAIRSLEVEICEFAELGDRIQYPVRTYSAGMLLRLAFSISLMSQSDILLIDEVIGVGDLSFLARTKARLAGKIDETKIVVVASHALDLLEGICDKAIYLREGRIIEFGPVAEVVLAYSREIGRNS